MSTIIHGDCLEVLAGMGPDSVDAVVTDPPYGTSGWRRTVAGAGSDPSGSLVVEEWDEGVTEWLGLLPQSVRVVMAFWPAARTLPLLQAAVVRGLTKHRTLYMRKPDPKPMVAGRTRWSVEPIWVLSADGFTLLSVETCAKRRGENGRTAHDRTIRRRDMGAGASGCRAPGCVRGAGVA